MSFAQENNGLELHYTFENPQMIDVTVQILLDDNPEQTTWTLLDAGNAVLFTGGPYNAADANQSIIETVSVPYAITTFIINDSGGDGICCGDGAGNYQVSDAANNIHAAGGSFAATESTTFEFSSCQPIDISGNSSNGFLIGDAQCGCGVFDQAIKLDGSDDRIFLIGGVSSNFNTEDFSVSFYFKTTSAFGTQDIISKRFDCDDNNAFAIKYTAASGKVDVIMRENSSKIADVSGSIDYGNCWQHVVFVRRGPRSLLYINGVLKDEAAAISRIDLTNSAELKIADGPCVGTTDLRYAGYLDEIRIYDRAVTEEVIEILSYYPDNIGNQDTLIFLGNSVDVFLTGTCADNFLWDPVDNISDPTNPTPTITPTESTVYTLSFIDDECIGFDTLKITVIDPLDLDCTNVYMPNAFTPNEDGKNDAYGVSNPYAIEKLTSLEIFDRWGSKVFETDQVFEKWDGNFKSKKVNPGVYLYRVVYECKGDELIDVGSLTIIR